MWMLKGLSVLSPAAVHQRQLHTFLTHLFALEGSAAGSGMPLCAPPRRSGTPSPAAHLPNSIGSMLTQACPCLQPLAGAVQHYSPRMCRSQGITLGLLGAPTLMAGLAAATGTNEGERLGRPGISRRLH